MRTKKYIQIGSASGNDYFYERVKGLNPQESEFFLIEPIQGEKTDLFYKNTMFTYHLITDAVVPNSYDRDEIILYLFGQDGNLSSALHRMAISPTHSVMVKALKIHNLLDLINDTIELLCVDAEGLDVEIINSINFEKYHIKEIFFEYFPFEDDKNFQFKASDLYKTLHDKLLKNNYELIETINTDGNTNFRYQK